LFPPFIGSVIIQVDIVPFPVTRSAAPGHRRPIRERPRRGAPRNCPLFFRDVTTNLGRPISDDQSRA
jgi:hypothetical protein